MFGPGAAENLKRKGKKGGNSYRCTVTGPPSEDDNDVAKCIAFIHSHSSLQSANRIWSSEDFLEQVVKPDPLPIFCSECGGGFDEPHPFERELPVAERVATLSCGNHWAHICCSEVTPLNQYTQTARGANEHTRLVQIPFEEFVAVPLRSSPPPRRLR